MQRCHTLFSNLETVCCSMPGSNCYFLTCIQISQEAGKVVWYSHFFLNFPQCIVVHTVKGHHGGTWDSPVGKPRGKASRESHRSLDPREGKRDNAAKAARKAHVHAPTREED